jgi:hypothetical protein
MTEIYVRAEYYGGPDERDDAFGAIVERFGGEIEGSGFCIPTQARDVRGHFETAPDKQAVERELTRAGLKNITWSPQPQLFRPGDPAALH